MKHEYGPDEIFILKGTVADRIREFETNLEATIKKDKQEKIIKSSWTLAYENGLVALRDILSKLEDET